MKFKVTDKEGTARAGTLKTPHGTIETPYWMPVATKASVKSISQEDLLNLNPSLLMANTYHLMLRPGADLIKKLGGLHRFMSWGGALMTDSGGFQVFSLGYSREQGQKKIGNIFPGESKRIELPKNVKITEEGVVFKSVYEDRTILLTPESSMKIQAQLGADLILAFDECTHPHAGLHYTKQSMERTHRWAERSLEAKERNDQSLFGIIQGGHWKSLRKKSAEAITSMPFEGIAIGGSLGKTKKDMHQILDWVIKDLPEKKPRHLLGIGTVEDCFEAVERGIDLFDCVGPTRIARSGYAHISPKAKGTKENKFRLNITRAAYRSDPRPIDPSCTCQICKTYSRAYIHHLFKVKEYLGYHALSFHNIHFMLNLLSEMRAAIKKKVFLRLKRQWLGT
ncbi:MAG: tRNA guanosine(34) transglycosylase Tgt [Nanoarchaeota archaeon]